EIAKPLRGAAKGFTRWKRRRQCLQCRRRWNGSARNDGLHQSVDLQMRVDRCSRYCRKKDVSTARVDVRYVRLRGGYDACRDTVFWSDVGAEGVAALVHIDAVAVTLGYDVGQRVPIEIGDETH